MVSNIKSFDTDFSKSGVYNKDIEQKPSIFYTTRDWSKKNEKAARGKYSSAAFRTGMEG